MQSFTKHTGKPVAFYQPDIDTDQILPKQFLKRIERSGYGDFLFYEKRFCADGNLNPEFVLNKPRYKNASVLITGKNFGCGSSREHAPWALRDYGFRVIIASAFADIFYNNCLKTGILPIVLDEDSVKILVERSVNINDYLITADLENLMLSDNQDFQTNFKIDEFHRQCLIKGLDDIDLSMQFEKDISRYETMRNSWLPQIK